MEIPTNLGRKLVIVVEDCDKVDGRNVLSMDAEGLSLSLAQWNDRGEVDISDKVWRHTGEKWSRQSEELPVTHILDLVTLTARGSLYFQDAYRYERFYDPENPVVDVIGLRGNRMTVGVDTKSPRIDEDIILYYDTLQRDGKLIRERFRILERLLNKLGC